MLTHTKQGSGTKARRPQLNVPEEELSQMLKLCCDLRRRGFTTRKTLDRTNWPRHYPRLLLEEAARRGLPGSEKSQEQALSNWLLSAFDAGIDESNMRRMASIPGHRVRTKLKRALDRTCGPQPAEIVTPGPDDSPGRVSWREKRRLIHRPIDGAFPQQYPAEAALEQCQQVFELLVTREIPQARDRAYTMLMIAEAGWHTLDHDDGRKLYNAFADAGMDDDAKRTVILNLHEHPSVGQLLLDRCGISPRWLTGNETRSMSRRLRQHDFSPSFTRHLVDHMGHNPDTYYMIGPEHRIPRPEPQAIEKCADALRKAGMDEQRIEVALATLGVPPGGHHPPKRSQP